MINFSKTIQEFREHIPVTKEMAYLETASTGLVPDFVYDGVRRYMDDRYLKGGDSVWVYDDDNVCTLEMHRRSKEAIAEMIHCDADEIVFGQSATHLFTLVTEGIDYSEHDNIVTVEKGWIGSRFAWQKRQDEGLEVRYVTPVQGMISVEAIIACCDAHTRAVAVNLVESTTGYRIDIEALGDFCQSHDILLFVDGVQAVGALNVDVAKAKIDFLVGNDYKWMMNFCGTGYAYISPKVQKLVHHWGAGWMSDAERFNTAKDRLELRGDAGRFEIGHQHNDGIYGLGLAAMQNNMLGNENIEAYIYSLAAYFRKEAEKTAGVKLAYTFPEKGQSQIVVIHVDQSLGLTDEDFKKAKIFIHMGRETADGCREMRICFHYYNNKADIDRFFTVIRGRRFTPFYWEKER